MVFPGQGSQSVGMLAAFAEAFPLVKKTFDEASAVVCYDLWQRVQQGPAELLNQTCCTQPALLAASVSIWRVWQRQGNPPPKLLAGHSLGEYSALVCAGALDFEQAIWLVEKRGRLMQAALPENTGAMAAVIGLTDEQILTLCAQAEQGEVVSAVNFNAPGQVVIAGVGTAVERATALCRMAGAKHVFPLAVSIPSHCSLMRPIAEKFSQALQKVTFCTPQWPVISNVDVVLRREPQAIKEALLSQLYSPVRWYETVRCLVQLGVRQLLEVGPGSVLTGLTKRTFEAVSAIAINHPAVLLAISEHNNKI